MSASFHLNKLALVGKARPSASMLSVVSDLGKSIAVVTVGDQTSAEGMHGTAMCVHPLGLYLSARHYIDRPDVQIVIDRPYAAEVVAVDDEKDMVLLSLKEFPLQLTHPVRFSKAVPDVGNVVAGVGHVLKGNDFQLALYEAAYASFLRESVAPADQVGLPAEWLECALLFAGSELSVPGFSGGPLVLPTGEVVALTSGGDGDAVIIGPSGAAAAEFVDWYTSSHNMPALRVS